MQPYRVMPKPDEWSAPYWEASNEDRLVLPQCQHCKYFLHPLRQFCFNCSNPLPDIGYGKLSGKGKLYSFTLEYHAEINGFEDKVPFITAVIELDDQAGLRVWGNILEADYEDLTLDLPVCAVWEETGAPSGFKMMQWRPETPIPPRTSEQVQ